MQDTSASHEPPNKQYNQDPPSSQSESVPKQRRMKLPSIESVKRFKYLTEVTIALEAFQPILREKLEEMVAHAQEAKKAYESAESSNQRMYDDLARTVSEAIEKFGKEKGEYIEAGKKVQEALESTERDRSNQLQNFLEVHFNRLHDNIQAIDDKLNSLEQRVNVMAAPPPPPMEPIIKVESPTKDQLKDASDEDSAIFSQSVLHGGLRTSGGSLMPRVSIRGSGKRKRERVTMLRTQSPSESSFFQ
ncbi:hypothetical protein HDU97_001296 [Phlyctochytrium planicorne]|nr:hypothetical protein HDU97_001296 [Phlyctochytrium planicorne]